MKIIANTSSGYLLEATKEELALIMGFRNSYSTGFNNDMLHIGTNIEIDKIDKVSRFVRNLDKDRLQSIKGSLESAITELDNAVDLTQNITLFAMLEEGDKK